MLLFVQESLERERMKLEDVVKKEITARATGQDSVQRLVQATGEQLATSIAEVRSTTQQHSREIHDLRKWFDDNTVRYNAV